MQHIAFPGDGTNPLIVAEIRIKENNNSIEIPGLDIIKHGGYVIECSKGKTVGSEYRFTVNAIETAASYRSQYIYAAGASASLSRPAAEVGMYLIYTGINTYGIGDTHISMTPSGIIVSENREARDFSSAGSNVALLYAGSQTLFTVPNLTRIRIFPTVANALDLDTTFILYRKK